MPSTDRADLRAFAAALVRRLPGAWTSDYLAHATYPDQFPRAEGVWDLSVVGHAIGEYVLEHDAILTGPAGTRLYVVDRPLRTDQFLVAPFEPNGIDAKHLRHASTPNGIALPRDPARAANLVVRRLLPRYHQAAAEARQAAQSPPKPLVVPPRLNNRVTMAWQEDGRLAATACHQAAGTTLFLSGFQYDPYEHAFVLDGYNEAEQARRIQDAAQQLSLHGIDVIVHRAPTPTTTPAPVPPTAPSPTMPRSAARR